MINIIKKFFHEHKYIGVAYNNEAGMYTKKCLKCGKRIRVKIKNHSQYLPEDKIAEWAGDSDYFLKVKV